MRKENKKIKKILVHGGIFHADDVMTVALAKTVNPEIEVQRVFAVPADISEDTIVADIGYGKYDHHQSDAKLRSNGDKYAACGLFFDDFWEYIFQTEEFKNKFEADYILPIELQDNGIGVNPLSKMISSFVPTWNMAISMEQAFDSAVAVLVELIRNAQAEESATIAAETEVCKHIAESTDDVVILDFFVPWPQFVIPTEKRFVVYPSRGQWNIQCVPKAIASREMKTPLPEQWLEKKPQGCTFVHAGRFLAAFTSCEDAVKAARTL